MNINSDRRKELGNYLKEKRVQAGLTQLAVAKSVKLTSAQSISNIERGMAPVPTFVLRRMIQLYQISEAEIMWKLMDLQLRQWRDDFFPEAKAASGGGRPLSPA
ncbi:MAG: helix-turn-helix domain-containing protein [Bdellovibrionales bacterium]|nr:helix-turn-helix domain-containing protein [Bdellovibrionales bacterium]